MLTKEVVQEILETKGECRGITLKMDWEFISIKKGKEALKILEEKMEEFGIPVKYADIKTMDFYPIGYDIVSVLCIKEIFDFSEKDLEEMGSSLIKFSIILRVFMRYFASPRLVFGEIPRMWKKHYTVGDLKLLEYDTKKKQVVIRLENFEVDPAYCTILKGCFSKITAMMVGFSVTCDEVKCTYRGDDYHEYFLKW